MNNEPEHPPGHSSAAPTDPIVVLHTAATQVARILGDPWTLDVDNPVIGNGPRLSAPHGVRLFFTRDRRNRTRVIIRGDFPHDPTYQNPRHEISVSHTRGPHAIAADIVRRLLPGYLPDLLDAQARERERASAFQARASVLSRIQVLLPGSATPNGHGPSATTVYLQCPSPVHGSIRIDYAGSSATLELGNLPVDTLDRILVLLADTRTV